MAALTRDDARAQQKKARERFQTAEKLEKEYARSLRYLTRQIDHIVKGMASKDLKKVNELEEVLKRYAETIKPWARSVAEKMLLRIARKDEASWLQLGKSIGKVLREELNDAPTGDLLRKFLDEQVHLITSLPLEAAQRVHKLAIEGMIQGGRRHDEIARDILQTGKVTESRARLIARTEIARVASGLTIVRAQHVGATHYIWRTSKDPDVRESHKKMEGVVVPFATMPILSDGTQCHAGGIYNCRCWPQPILMKD